MSTHSLKRNVDQLESKIDELHKNLAEAQKNWIAEKRKNERLEKERNSEDNCVTKVNIRKMEVPINESLHDDVVSIILCSIFMWEEEVNNELNLISFLFRMVTWHIKLQMTAATLLSNHHATLKPILLVSASMV